MIDSLRDAERDVRLSIGDILYEIEKGNCIII